MSSFKSYCRERHEREKPHTRLTKAYCNFMQKMMVVLMIVVAVMLVVILVVAVVLMVGVMVIVMVIVEY